MKDEHGEKFSYLWSLLDRKRNLDPESLRDSFVSHLEYSLGKYKYNINGTDVYRSLAYCLRDILLDRWNVSQDNFRQAKTKRVYYISIEFLMGGLLNSQLVNLGLREPVGEMLGSLGFNLDDIINYEPDAGLGNGGLGRLAACFLDSMATLGLSAAGSSLRYEFGMFNQQIVDGYQREAPDNWLSMGNPWELTRPDIRFPIGFAGYTEHNKLTGEHSRSRWYPEETVFATAGDVLIPGDGFENVANLRLWRAGSYHEFKLDYFNHGDYMTAMHDTVNSEYITKVLYPNENVEQGRELRLKQEYFLVSATIQDAIKTLEAEGGTVYDLNSRVVFQLNDTHPALAVAELMRILIDVYGLHWDRAWNLTVGSLAYTNHTLLPEALERWELDLFKRLLPRHLEIIYLINHLLIDDLRSRGFPEDKIARISIIEEGSHPRVRMANLAVIGSFSVNGVSGLHSQIIRESLFKDFSEIWPNKFNNKTNGVTHRRWLVSANPDLSELISKRIGAGWSLNLDRLRDLEEFSEDPEFQADWEKVKNLNKDKLARIIRFESGYVVDPEAMFDIHVKRIHEYKRQLLNVLRVIGDYWRIKQNPTWPYTSRVVVFAGKAAPGYYMARMMIKLINTVADVVNRDRDMDGKLRVVFLANFCVSLAERIYPAADLSEQISTAGMEASGTGNMKFMLNGALTVGTLDGANVEMLEEVGDENIYIFGKRVEELAELSRQGYNPWAIYNQNEEIRRVLDSLKDVTFAPREDPSLFESIFHSLTEGGDHYYHLTDFHEYMDIQERIGRDFLNRADWTRRSILNTARSGKFSSDRTIAEYARDIWKVSRAKSGR